MAVVSSSFPYGTWVHGVFLCFRGEDTLEGFTGHLFQALAGSGIDAFMDERLPRGRDISELHDRIEKSRVSVVVFSENFASSRWCLDELVKILECKGRMGQEVFPVFYKVPPSELREPRGKTAEYLAEHRDVYGVNLSKIEQWKLALKYFADLKGWHFTRGNESGLVAEIVKTLQNIPGLKTSGFPRAGFSLGIDIPIESDVAKTTITAIVILKVAALVVAILLLVLVVLLVRSLTRRFPIPLTRSILFHLNVYTE